MRFKLFVSGLFMSSWELACFTNQKSRKAVCQRMLRSDITSGQKTLKIPDVNVIIYNYFIVGKNVKVKRKMWLIEINLINHITNCNDRIIKIKQFKKRTKKQK